MAPGIVRFCVLLLFSCVCLTRAVTNEELKEMLVTLTKSQTKLRSEVREMKRKLDRQGEEKQQITTHLIDLLQDVRSLVTYQEEEGTEREMQADRIEKSLATILERLKGTEVNIRPTTTMTPTTTTGDNTVCGSIAHKDPRGRDPDDWTLCYITKSYHKSHLRARCRDLIKDVTSPRTGEIYSDASVLLSAGGNFGCWRGFGGISSRIEKACQTNQQHQGRLADCGNCDIYGLCIKYPTVPTLRVSAVPVVTSPGICGSIAKQDTSGRAPSGWVLCYITKTEHNQYRTTMCKDLIQNLVQARTGKRYANDAALKSARGNFGCWRGSRGLSSRINAACQANYQQKGKLSDCAHCDILGVCIRYPR